MGEKVGEKLSRSSDGGPQSPGRRMFLKLAMATVGAAVLGACVPDDREEAPHGSPERIGGEDESYKPPMLHPEFLSWMNEAERVFREKGSRDLRNTLESPRLAGDLPLYNDPVARKIWGMPNGSPLEVARRFAWSVGMLNVLKWPRYNNGKNTCNVYAADATRLVIGPHIRGNRVVYPLSYVVYRDDLDYFPSPLLSEQALRKIENDPRHYGWMSSDILTRMLRNSGKNFGWREVGSQDAMLEAIMAGNLVLGATKPENISSENIGHAFIVGPGIDQDGHPIPVLSQSTMNIQAQPIYPNMPKEADPLAWEKTHPGEDSQYAFFAHKMNVVHI